MKTLNATNKKLKLKLSVAVTTNELDFTASYVDITTTAQLPGEQDGVSNGTAFVDALSSPAASTQRKLLAFSLSNTDTVAAEALLAYDNNGTVRQILKVTLDVNDSLIYTETMGWNVLDASGRIKSFVSQNITLTGDVTGSGSTNIAATIANGAVTLAKQSALVANSIVGNNTGGASTPLALTGAQVKAMLSLVKGDVGLGNVDNTTDAGKPVSTAQQTALDLKANLAAPTFTGVPAAPTAGAGTNTTQLATTAFVTAINNNASYRILAIFSASHTAAKVAGTYALSYGDLSAVGGAGIVYPLGVFHIVGADFPTVNGITTKLRIRAQLYTNDVAPTGNYTFGLYPITRPGTSGGAGVCIFTLGTVVAGSNGATFTGPAADLLGSAVGADFTIPADGPYVIAVVTTGTVAVSSHVHLHAQLQQRNA